MKNTVPSKTQLAQPKPPPDRPANSKPDQLIALARANATFFHTPADMTAYAEIKRDAYTEIVALSDSRFGDWLKVTYFRRTHATVPAGVFETVVGTLAAIATEHGEAHEVHRRVAKLGERYYLDLCDNSWRVIEVDNQGWRILDRSPVKFIRSSTMRALPEPKRGGKFKPLLDVLNIPKKHWIILLTWMIECLRPETNYVGLELVGMQGSAKSTAQRMLVDFIDPQSENLLVKPRAREDIFVTAAHSHMLSYENLSELGAPIQDALCSMLTGAAFQKRKNYSDTSVATIKFKRPVILNGINRTVTRADLLDRFICFELPTIPDGASLDEGKVAHRLEAMKGEVFGAMLQRFSKALALLPEVREQDLPLPRMADFALLGEAVAQSLNKRPGHFCRSYRRLRGSSISQLLAGSPLGFAIVSCVGKHADSISGSLTDVYEQLLRHSAANGGVISTHDGWPKRGKGFANELRRLAPALQQTGILVAMTGLKKDGYHCSIQREQKARRVKRIGI